ncbi:DUF3263 domain-containing protein [Streptomyces microflavus]|uniref:DUF3263 domain-containing protein n=1 Tax=Streptomyces microflavus TaxID=1919 RepID=UPI003456BCE6
MTAPDAEPAPAGPVGPEPSEPSEPAGPAEPGPGGRAPAAPADRELSVRERAVLALERRSWAGPGAKERAIREELGISPVRYFQLLNALIEDERALREDPVTVNRLRRLRAARRERR